MHAPRSYEKWFMYRDYIYMDKAKGYWCIKSDAPEECKRSYDLWWNMNFNPWYGNKEWFPDYPNLGRKHRKKGRFVVETNS